MADPGADEVFSLLDLGEYERQALETLLEVGRSTAPDCAAGADIPKARVYDVLDGLANDGYIRVIPGRPKEYEPRAPAEILDAAIEGERQDYESFVQAIEAHREAFLETYQPRYEAARADVSPTEELFHVVDVGDPSERETRAIYGRADEAIDVLTKSFEYFEAVEPAVADALERGVTLRVLCLDPELLSAGNAARQADIVPAIRESYPGIDLRFSRSRLPWRGTIADPSMDYETGEAIFLVEEPDIPLHKRQAAVTENPSLVAGLERYFALTWEHDTLDVNPYD